MDGKEPESADHHGAQGDHIPEHGIAAGSHTTEDQLRAAKEYAEMIVDTVRESLLVLTTDLRVEAANQVFYETFQETPEETTGRLVYELGDGQWDIPELRRLLEEILPEQKTFDDFQVQHEFKDVGTRVMLLNARRLDHHDLILLAIEDVTERRRDARELRKSEQRFRLLVDNAKEYAIFTMDAEGRIATWSPGAERIFGWSDEEAIGQPGAMIFTAVDRQKDAPEREAEHAKANGSALDERWHIRRDGSEFWASGVLVALREEDELYGYTKIIRDNTEQKQAEEERNALLEALEHERSELQKLNATLEERVEDRTRQVRELASMLTKAEQQERRRIAQILHDDLQQHLYGIQMKMSFIRQRAGANEADGVIENASEAEEWLRQAIDIARNLSVDLSPPVLEGEGLRDTLVWLVSQMEEMHGLTVDLQAEHAFRMPDEDMRVLLFQIVRELLFNVVKHAGTDRATVRLNDIDHHLEVHVTDEGRGFDIEATAREDDGDTFGLFSVRERLRLFDGSMSIDSSPGEGTHVTVSVPIELEQ